MGAGERHGPQLGCVAFAAHVTVSEYSYNILRRVTEFKYLDTDERAREQKKELRLLVYIRTSRARSFIFSRCSIHSTSIDEEKLIRLSP